MIKLTISRDLLQAACKIVQPALSNSSINPILTFMHFELGDGKLKLTCTDGDLEIQQIISVPSDVDGELLIPGIHFTGIVSKLPKGDVTLEAEGNKLTVKCARSKFTIPLHPDPDAFPPSVKVGELAGLNSTCGDIAQLMSLGGYCGTTGAETKWFGYVLCKLEAGTLEIASVGGEKAVAFCSLPGISGIERAAWHIPTKYFQLAQKLISDADAETHIYICGERRLSFQWGNTVISLPLGTLGFADHRKPMPPEINTSVRVDAADLTDALKRLEVARSFRTFAPDNCVDMSAGDGQLILSVDHGQDGTASEQVAAEITGDLRYSLDSGSLLKALGPVTTGEVTLNIMDGQHPLVVKAPRFPDWVALVSNLVK